MSGLTSEKINRDAALDRRHVSALVAKTQDTTMRSRVAAAAEKLIFKSISEESGHIPKGGGCVCVCVFLFWQGLSSRQSKS